MTVLRDTCVSALEMTRWLGRPGGAGGDELPERVGRLDVWPDPLPAHEDTYEEKAA